jgi:hypothetical protein
MFSRIAWLRGPARWARAGVLVGAGAVVMLGGFAGAPLRAAGETGSPAQAADEASAPGGSGSATCPSSNPPNELTLVAGTPQTAMVGTVFATSLQLALANSNGCPVTSATAGIPVTFSAPASGASGVFSTSASHTAIVGADATGAVVAPPFTADAVAGGYTVTASSQYGSVSFSLTNTAAGIWCSTLGRRASASAGETVKITAGVGSTQSTRAGARFPIRLAVTATDAEGNPVAGTPITFTAPVAGASGRFTVPARDPHHDRARFSHPYKVEVRTDACGIAVAPVFTANRIGGGYVVEATVERVRPAVFALVNEARGHSS